jgi:hypothetical protein
MNITGIRSHFTNWREWELNPIVVKELRQAVRSWAVTGMLLLFLVVLFISSLMFLVFQSFDVDPDVRLGSAMFSAFVSILAAASIFFIPLYVGIRIAAERQENNPDLFYVSTLSPTRIILGKFLCGAYMAVLFFSACMPFMAFTNLLRGVDLPTVFFILFYLFLVVCAANMVSIFLACVPASRPFKILFGIVGFIASFWIIIPMVALSFGFLRSGIGASMGDRNFWIGTLTVVSVGLSIMGLFFVLAVALISPPSANRALPVRIYVTAIWLLGGLLSLGWIAKTGNTSAMSVWMVSVFWLMICSLLVVVSNSDHLSQRVRHAIPQSPLKRAVAFLFFNGAAGGIIWVAIMLAISFFISQEITAFFPKSITLERSRPWFAIVGAYSFAYALTALFIHRKFFPNRPAKLTGLLTIFLAAVWALVPSTILFFLNELSWKSVERLELGNIFNVFSMRDDNRLNYHLYFALAWLGLMMLLNAPWFVTQAKNFVRPPQHIPPVIQ